MIADSDNLFLFPAAYFKIKMPSMLALFKRIHSNKQFDVMESLENSYEFLHQVLNTSNFLGRNLFDAFAAKLAGLKAAVN